MKTNAYTGTLTPRPSIIRKKLEYRGTIDPESTGVTPMKSTANVDYGWDVDNGEVKVFLDSENLKEAIHQFKSFMKENNIPFVFEDRSTFFLDASQLKLSDISVLESEGFVKKEVDNRDNCIDYIWELRS